MKRPVRWFGIVFAVLALVALPVTVDLVFACKGGGQGNGSDAGNSGNGGGQGGHGGG